MDSTEKKLHVFVLPFLLTGHMIPMIDIARLFAQRGLTVTIITTPLNASRFKANIDRAQHSGHRIRIADLRFPCSEAGLPEGCENADTISSSEMNGNFIRAIEMLQNPFEELLSEHNPDFIISDSFLPWTLDSATKFNIPRLVFNVTSCFAQCCVHNMVRYVTHQELATNSDLILIPDLPDPITMKKTQDPFFKEKIQVRDLLVKAKEADSKSFGVVFNSFYELEPAYVNYYQSVMGMKKAWPIGPVYLCNKELLDKADRGNKASIEHSRCFDWLDSQNPNSVLYVCFGSLCRFPSSQLVEIATSLESCNHPFIWVINSWDQIKMEELLSQGYEERIGGKGLIIRGWAAQILILSHPSIGGFMSHCGWNSTLEGVTAGVPFITWPTFAEQFYNEKMIVEVLKVGVSVGNEEWAFWEEQEIVELVKREKIEQVVDLVMGGGEEGKGMRRRAKEYGEMARRATEEGGSSTMNMSLLIKDLMQHKAHGRKGDQDQNDSPTLAFEGEL